MNFKRFMESEWDDLFPPTQPKTPASTEQSVESFTLELYRGFDADLSKIRQDEHFYYLSPERSEQQQIWFTHKFIAHYDPVEYARSKGQWLLTYHINCKRHMDVTKFTDGSTSRWPTDLPDGRDKDGNLTYWSGIELPPGWVFSYKMEKFIGCKKELKVPKTSIVPS